MMGCPMMKGGMTGGNMRGGMGTAGSACSMCNTSRGGDMMVKRMDMMQMMMQPTMSKPEGGK